MADPLIIEHFISREECKQLLAASKGAAWARLLLATCKEPSLNPFEDDPDAL